MITLKDLKIYGFDSIERYFEYIQESHINGNFTQCKELVKELSKTQKAEFIYWLMENAPDLKRYIK
jgi:hypothetical protein